MRIMVCYDGSDESREGLMEAIKHAKAFDAEVMVVTSALSDHKDYPIMMEPVEQNLNQAQALLDENNIICKTCISYRGVDMSIGEDLVEFARREHADEVIVGIRARSRVGKFLLGSVAQWLMLKAECPVIGVKKMMTR
ncbi:universal stress protein [Desulforhabdus amnigena]|uniref:Universal stress protein n=1 Tax=Desulforhabdus amnigena TaxID=40218 RepID=A0A9W6FRI3_9BACT|nr:universal stress protein [Desulforhabdus amnigena]NLJ27691.1 universal stress protein [Deltaproteobacteria bacterium]GLI33019.1 universal stress protein [Desulforhabdus amnigena]